MIWREGEPAQRYVRVLLVDDDEDDALIARELLSEAEHVRFAVTWARDADSAVDLLARQRFDACLLDLRLGAASGLEVLAAAKAKGFDGPIIMLTGADEHEVDMRAMEAGATDYLVKTRLDAPLLERTIRYALANHVQREAVREHARKVESANRALERTRAELEASNARLADLVRRQNELLGMVAHDLRNPLGIVLGYASFLRDGLSTLELTEQSDLLERIERSVRFMISMIDDLLDLSAIESGTITLDRQERELGALVKDAVEAHRWLASPKQIAVRYEPPGGEVKVSVDPRRFEQVMQNLIGNAIKYSNPETTVTVRVETRGRRARVSVEDQGIGIAPELKDRVFMPFTRAQHAGTRGEKSVGLGLTIVRRIVDAHGGTVGVESQLGKGSRFTVEIPLAS